MTHDGATQLSSFSSSHFCRTARGLCCRTCRCACTRGRRNRLGCNDLYACGCRMSLCALPRPRAPSAMCAWESTTSSLLQIWRRSVRCGPHAHTCVRARARAFADPRRACRACPQTPSHWGTCSAHSSIISRRSSRCVARACGGARVRRRARVHRTVVSRAPLTHARVAQIQRRGRGGHSQWEQRWSARHHRQVTQRCNAAAHSRPVRNESQLGCVAAAAVVGVGSSRALTRCGGLLLLLRQGACCRQRGCGSWWRSSSARMSCCIACRGVRAVWAGGRRV